MTFKHVEGVGKVARHRERFTAVGVPYGFCGCGCGSRTNIAAETNTRNARIAGEPSLYLVGHNRRGVTCIPDPVVDENGCWIWQGAADPLGYGRAGNLNGEGTALAHRIYYEREHGPLPAHLHLHHRCEVPACVNPDHLEPLERREHMRRHARLSTEDVRAIRASTGPLGPIAQRYGVSKGHVSNIRTGRHLRGVV